MKRIAIILIAITAIFVSCSKTDVWLDHDNPEIYIARPGVTFNEAWMVDSKEYTLEMEVYLGGVRPSNQESSIEVTFDITSSLVDAYNNDITQEYAGQVIPLPADCYEIAGNTVTIPDGSVATVLPIRIFTDKVEALAMGEDDIYVIPVKLTASSKYSLSDNEGQLESLFGVTLDEPRFYFWDNRNAVSSPLEISKKVIFGETPKVENFKITSYGVNINEDYTLTFEVDTSMVPVGEQLLPADAYELPVTSVTIPEGEQFANLPIKIINDNVAFREVFYLPVTITAASKYSADPVKGTLLLKVNIKNDYEWSYVSRGSATSVVSGRTVTNQLTKAPESWDENTLLTHTGLLTSGTGLTLGTGTYVRPLYAPLSSYRRTFKVKVIPTDNPNKWDVEYIIDGDTNADASFIADPDKESYYDWDNETFYLNYGWIHTGPIGGSGYVWVSEILEAQF